jgi:hypothetical protein
MTGRSGSTLASHLTKTRAAILASKQIRGNWQSNSSTHCTRPSLTLARSGGGLSRRGFVLLALLVKHHRSQSLDTEPGRLQGKQQPNIPPQHLLQHTPILCGQRVTVEALALHLSVLTTPMYVFGSLHRGLHPLLTIIAYVRIR